MFQIIEYARSHGLYISLFSNGCLLDERRVQRLGSAGTGSVGISIYGASPETHDDFTQTLNSFSQTIKGIRNASSAGLETVVNVVVTPKNMGELHLLPSLLDGVDAYAFASVVPSGRGSTAPEHVFSESGYKKAVEKIERDFSGIVHYYLSSLYPESPYELNRYCVRPVEEVVINHEGLVIPCCLLPKDLRHHAGKVEERSLDGIVDKDPVFHWLTAGHRSMRDRLNYSCISHNLCKSCIDMLHLLIRGQTTDSHTENRL